MWTTKFGLASSLVVAPHGRGGEHKHLSATALALGSASAGFLEIAIFHPVDTIAKRLMSNQSRLVVPGTGFSQTWNRLLSVALRAPEPRSMSFVQKWLSLFPGLGFATMYKVSQRVYKFGGQPIANDAVYKLLGRRIRNTVGDKMSKPITNAIAGSLIGIGEVIILPLDVLKIKRQTNPGTMAGRSTWDIIRSEGFNLYRGGAWTAARNAPGSFALFGASALTKEYVFKLKNYNDASFFQNFVGSTMGAVASIAVSNPLDVIKTRIQNKDFNRHISGREVLRELIANEGPAAFFKGFLPKTIVVAPKLIFSFTMAQWLSSRFDTLLTGTGLAPIPALAQPQSGKSAPTATRSPSASASPSPSPVPAPAPAPVLATVTKH